MDKKLSTQELVKVKLMDLVNEQLKFGQLAELIIFTIVLMMLWGIQNHTVLLIWYVLCASFCIIRYAGTLYYRYSKRHEDIKKWTILLVVSAFIAGSSWGPIGSIFLSINHAQTETTLIIIVLAGLVGATMFYSPIKHLYFAFLLPSYLPHIVWLFYGRENLSYLSLTAIIFFFLLMIFSYYINRYITNAIKLQFENIGLIRDLSLAKNELEIANNKLIKENLEAMSLYNQLQEAQSIAHLGSWTRDIKTGEVIYSSEGAQLLALNERVVHFQEIFNRIYPPDRKHYEEIIANAIENRTGWEAELRFIVNKKIHWLHVTGRSICDTNSNKVVKLQGTVMDTTSRKLAELRKNMEHRSLEALISSESPIRIAIKKILQIIAETYNWELGCFWTFDEERQLFKRNVIWAKEKSILETYLKIIPQDEWGPRSHFILGKISETRQPQSLSFPQLNDVVNDSYRELFQKLAIKNSFGFPVIINDKIIAILDFLDRGNNLLTKDDLQSIHSINNQLGLFIRKNQAQLRENELNKQLIMTARQIGMADVASSVLHNIGNILNSVNVSANVLQEKLQRSKILNGFLKVNDELIMHSHDFNQYLTEDPRGKNLQNYLGLLAGAIQDERVTLSNELSSLIDNVQHIKDVVQTQQAFSHVLGMVERVSISEQLDAAIKLIGLDSSYFIECDYAADEPMLIDKVKLLQIVINLLNNAKEAIIEAGINPKKIQLTTEISDDKFIRIQITDNGIGIPSDNLDRVFSFGFTTKVKGHGFGLHNSALLAKQLGGSLKAASEGHGKGATFTLELPCAPPTTKEDNHE